MVRARLRTLRHKRKLTLRPALLRFSVLFMGFHCLLKSVFVYLLIHKTGALRFETGTQVSAIRQTFLRSDGHYQLGQKHRSPFAKHGVVVAYCGGSLEWLANSINCRSYEVYIYYVCNSTLMDALSKASSIRECTTVTHLQSNKYGKSHVAYLSHILRKWNELHAVTFFVKDKSIASQRRMKATHFPHLGYMSLDDFDGRRGPSFFGKTTYQFGFVQDLQRALVRNEDTLDDTYIAFGSAFAASSSRIWRNNKDFYAALLSFVTSELQGRSNPFCVSSVQTVPCCNCESLERTWSTLLNCRDHFTVAHHLLQEKFPIHNPIPHKICYDGHWLLGPLILVKACDLTDTRCFRDTSARVYLAFILRWNIIVSCELDRVCVAQVQRLNSTIAARGIQVKLYTVLPDYDSYTYRDWSCNLHLNCSHESILRESWEIVGNFILKEPLGIVQYSATHDKYGSAQRAFFDWLFETWRQF